MTPPSCQRWTPNSVLVMLAVGPQRLASSAPHKSRRYRVKSLLDHTPATQTPNPKPQTPKNNYLNLRFIYK